VEVEQVEIREHLRRFLPFSRLTGDWLDTIARAVEITYFRAGSSILSLGTEISDLHYIRSGAVEITRRDGELYNRLGEGEIFGQLGLMTGIPVRFPVRALEDALIYYIPGDLFRKLFDEFEDFADFVEVEDRTRMRQASTSLSGANELMLTRVSQMINRPAPVINKSATIQAVAAQMAEEEVSSILVIDAPPSKVETRHKARPDRRTIAGIITDSDVISRVVANGLPLDTPAIDVMTPEPITVQDDQFLFNALLIMLRANVHHLPVMRRNQLVGVIDMADIVSHETRNSLFIVRNILQKDDVDSLSRMLPDVEACFVRMVNEDASSHMIGSAMSTIGRSFKQRLLELAEEALGPPPVPYCFLALGSMARDEQFLYTDQDNGIVLDDAFDPDLHDEYFASLSRFVCDGLANVGYRYCSGDIMATNPRWRKPLKDWKERFRRWIGNPRPEALLHSSIFFDLDGVHGQVRLADQLKSEIAEVASSSQSFLGCLAQNAQKRTPPLGFFKNFVLERGGRHANSINLKRRGTAPLVDVIRVHALASASESQNSFNRLEDTIAAGFLTPSMGGDLRDALEFISIIRARHQSFNIENRRKPDNNIDPETLSAFDRRNLKDAFGVLANAQKFLKFRYRPNRGT